MPTISAFYGILIRMYWSDHAPPHFHAQYAGYEVVIDIRSLVVREGEIPKRAETMVLEWAAAHQLELLEDWELCTQNQLPKKIEPLR